MRGLEQASRHVDALAAELGLTVRRGVKRGTNRERIRGRVIIIAGINSDTDYYGALHEMGHAVIGNYGPARLLEEEADAWSWALEKALWPPSGKVKREIGGFLNSYLCGKKGERSNRPPEIHPFWEMLAWREQYAKPQRRQERRLP